MYNYLFSLNFLISSGQLRLLSGSKDASDNE